MILMLFVYCNMSFWPLWRAFPPLDLAEGNNSWDELVSLFFSVLDTDDWLLLGLADIYWVICSVHRPGALNLWAQHSGQSWAVIGRGVQTSQRALQLLVAWMCFSSKEKNMNELWWSLYAHTGTQYLWHEWKWSLYTFVYRVREKRERYSWQYCLLQT